MSKDLSGIRMGELYAHTDIFIYFRTYKQANGQTKSIS